MTFTRFSFLDARGPGQRCCPAAEALQVREGLREAGAVILSAEPFEWETGAPAWRALSIRQPHAALIAAGRKRIETRSWSTNYRGPILIHAAAGPVPREARQQPGLMEMAAGLPDVRGAFVAVAFLTDCRPITPELIAALPEAERTAGYYSPSRFAWTLEDVRPLPEPVPARGHLGIWSYEEAISCC